MNKTMFFSFEHPITFERIYDFNNPDHPFNSSWVAEDSNPLFIKTTNYRAKKTLVKNCILLFLLSAINMKSCFQMNLVIMMIFVYHSLSSLIF